MGRWRRTPQPSSASAVGIVFIGPSQDAVERAGDKRKFPALAESMDSNAVTPGVVVETSDPESIRHAVCEPSVRAAKRQGATAPSRVGTRSVPLMPGRSVSTTARLDRGNRSWIAIPRSSSDGTSLTEGPGPPRTPLARLDRERLELAECSAVRSYFPSVRGEPEGVVGRRDGSFDGAPLAPRLPGRFDHLEPLLGAPCGVAVHPVLSRPTSRSEARGRRGVSSPSDRRRTR